MSGDRWLRHYVYSVPVTIIITLAMLFIFWYKIGGSGSCQKTFISHLSNTFLHASTLHIIGTVLALGIMSRIEYDQGSLAFTLLITSLVVISSLLEHQLRLWNENTPCGIGFSSIVIGLVAFELKGSTLLQASPLLLTLIYPSLINPSISFEGHAIGAVTGLFMGKIFPEIMLETLRKKCHTHRRLPPWVGRGFIGAARPFGIPRLPSTILMK
jgi:membrane associated rhomboid family serine protease